MITNLSRYVTLFARFGDFGTLDKRLAVSELYIGVIGGFDYIGSAVQIVWTECLDIGSFRSCKMHNEDATSAAVY